MRGKAEAGVFHKDFIFNDHFLHKTLSDKDFFCRIFQVECR